MYSFDPARFTSPSIARQHRQAWIPFGAGQRKCIAQEFSLMKSLLVLIRILQHYQLTFVAETGSSLSTTQMRASSSMKSKAGIFLEFTPRF
ncbi:cytochrome P450 [Chloroflexi bacterium TSY]|nr:cytochrome P450 [Chloroflexi bacterium TSY]